MELKHINVSGALSRLYVSACCVVAVSHLKRVPPGGCCRLSIFARVVRSAGVSLSVYGTKCSSCEGRLERWTAYNFVHVLLSVSGFSYFLYCILLLSCFSVVCVLFVRCFFCFGGVIASSIMVALTQATQPHY